MTTPCAGLRWSPGVRLLVALLGSTGGGLAGSALGAQQPAAAISAASPAAFGPRDSVTAFVHVAVIPMDRERVLRDQTVVVRDGRIVALGPAKRVAVPAGAARVDGRSQYLLPALSDMHTHELIGLGPNERDRMLLRYLALGVTTVREMHGGTPASDDSKGILALKRQLAAGELLGPHVYTAGDPNTASPEAAAASVAALQAEGHDFVKLYAFPQPVYDSVVRAAQRVGLRVVGHVPGGGQAWDCTGRSAIGGRRSSI